MKINKGIVYSISTTLLLGQITFPFVALSSPDLKTQIENKVKLDLGPDITEEQTKSMISEIATKIRTEYVEQVREDKLLEGALNGMLGSLDPHSAYYSPKTFSSLQKTIQAEYGGLGLEVLPENGIIKVISPMDDSPGFKAGLLPGDLIVAVDNKPLIGLTPTEAIDKLKGKPGEKISISVRRENSPPLELTLTREIIKPPSVKWRREGNIGYVRIGLFNQNTTSGLQLAIQEFKTELGQNLQGILIDLRNNPGGVLDQAISVSELFLPKDKDIVSTKGRDSKVVNKFVSRGDDVLNGLPIAILINAASASASEIVAGALQDHKRAVILGTKSTGKGSVQIVVPLSNGGAIKYTTSLYFTPSGRSIQKTGILPDVTIEKTKVQETLEPDYLREQNINNALEAPPQMATQEKDQRLLKLDPTGKHLSSTEKCALLKKQGPMGFSKESEADKLDCDPSKDYQLLRALDILRGVSAMHHKKIEGNK
jgi:carboxyl-terminal processing protease